MRKTLFDSIRRAFGTPPSPRIQDALWNETTSGMTFLRGLSEAEMIQLRALTEAFLAEKHFSAAEGFSLTDEICLSITVQGCLPILNLGLDSYRDWHGIIVYPDEFVIPREIVDEDGIVHSYDEIVAGEVWSDGPVIISWQDVGLSSDDYNVVIHEFAHKLDMQNGTANGMPPLHKNMSHSAWRQAFEDAYDALCAEVYAAITTGFEPNSFLDPYAAENPAEFFAVASEAFFNTPHELRAIYPALYEQFVLYYRQDPAARIAAPSTSTSATAST